MATIADYRVEQPTWCPGCGDFSVLAALQKASVNLGIEPEDMVTVSGIGCSGKISQHFGSYGFHSIHGRLLPTATGVKLANDKLTVVAAGGDGDGYGIGVGHFIHAMRRNINITYIVMDNLIYGLTTGQTSPTSKKGSVTKTAPDGSIDEPVSPLELALVSGCSFVSQAFSGNVKELTSIIEAGIKHEGFSLINVFSPCVTFNKVNTYQFFKGNLQSVGEDYQPNSKYKALELIEDSKGLVTGILYKNDKVTYDQAHGMHRESTIVNLDLDVSSCIS
jgi:2-oxoglutarate ferredoxin oxidoreductase subunit beta